MNHSNEEIEPILFDAEPDGREEPEIVDNVERRHLEIIAKAKSLPFKTGSQVEAFKNLVMQYQADIMNNETEERRTFLHTMAAAPNPTDQIKFLAAHVLANPNGVKLMEKRDNEGKTPLYLAITNANRPFLMAATGNPSSAKTIERVANALAVGENVRGESTSLHAAVSNQRKITMTILGRIIQMAPKMMFRIQDASGCTPLHLAVEASRCVGDQLQVVRALIARGPSVLEMASGRGYSVYQYHMMSRQSTMVGGGERSSDGINGNPPRTMNDMQVLGSGQNPDADWDIKPPKRSMTVNMSGKPPLEQDQRDQTLQMKTGGNIDSSPAPSTPVEPLPETTTAGRSSSRRALAQDHRKVADAIMDELKLQSLRIMGCDAVLRCLHTDRELWFDYEPGPRYPMTFRDFEMYYNGLEFDPMLQYVALPNIHFKPGEDEDQPPGRTRDDAARILKWLQRRGVRRVLRVIVHDGSRTEGSSEPGGYYHSNETIASALDGLDVEILDWRRPDLCSTTIVQIGRSLRELRLQWSGNNAMLRAWSELQGLPMLAGYGKLEQISIAVPEDGPDIGPRTKKNLDAFRARFVTNWVTMAELLTLGSETKTEDKTPVRQKPPNGNAEEPNNTRSPRDILLNSLIERLTEAATASPSSHALQELAKTHKFPRIKIEDISGGHRFTSFEVDEGAGSKSKHKSHLDQHRWIQCMEEFSAALKEVPQPTKEEIRAHPSLEPILVALIDDGVDTTNPSLQKKKYRGKSFDFYEGGRRSESYWVSKTGHGTIMAKFLRTVCPTADIYVIKLGTAIATKDPDKLTIDVDSAVKAINHAVDQGAKIISMSWSVTISDDNERNLFNKAINRAIAANIIMFCAASDQGHVGDKTYPYASNKGYIFRVGAATSMGTMPSYTGDPKDIQFLFPGHDVLLKDDSPDKHLGDVQRGSSIATALAAGLAGLVLECVRLGYLRTLRTSKELRDKIPFVIQDFHVSKRMDADGMRSAFLKMSRSTTGYIWVWEFFTAEDNEKLKDETSAGRLDIISGMAWKLLGK